MATDRTASRIDPDTRPVLVVATVSAALIAIVSFALSAAGLVQVAAWAHVPWFLRWGAPVMIDAIAAQIGIGRTAVHEIVRTLKTQEASA